ncbi:glyoxalase family protein [Pelagirhabdus alkalitolerans]|uniref:Glyoxalase family protein n=1 Tax=Pelagirhabdus alkalitolerans TaxID=1612202 RepID=A0A1G6GM02_9BACI|nr:ring-cleaving dioxygenase [Pelagirhabdus alkalitolerans]SDB82196.1 glyoxalase family protein [Pelagirhabdus alkalitolerans]
MQILGIHHVSALTANAQKNYDFYADQLGMRLVKKSVNQDSPSMYHLFYADEIGRPGTDLTFFEMLGVGHTYRGNNSISETGLRVQDDEAIHFWKKRFEQLGIKHEPIKTEFGRLVLRFEDHESQRLALVSDEDNEGVEAGVPFEHPDIPKKFGITGLGPVRLTVPKAEHTRQILGSVLTFENVGSYPARVENGHDIEVYQTGEGGTGAEIQLEERSNLTKEKPGRGSVHHVALRVKSVEELREVEQKVKALRLPTSGVVNRYYFQSLYFRDLNGILFELATDAPGFLVDEDESTLGEKLALPPFLEDKREQIERQLKPIKMRK